MAKKHNDYYSLIEHQSSFCVQAAALLEKLLTEFDFSRIDEYREHMHGIEHAADEVHHDILAKLSTEFITPIDQEDILSLVQVIDDITDALDEVILDFYMYHVSKVQPAALMQARIVDRCVNTLYLAIKELRVFKKSKSLRSILVSVNDIEVEGDIVYLDAMHKLFADSVENKTLLGNKAIYESLEECCDLCEDAADIIEQVIIKNT